MNRFGQLSKCVTLHANPIVNTLRYLSIEIDRSHAWKWPSNTRSGTTVYDCLTQKVGIATSRQRGSGLGRFPPLPGNEKRRPQAPFFIAAVPVQLATQST